VVTFRCQVVVLMCCFSIALVLGLIFELFFFAVLRIIASHRPSDSTVSLLSRVGIRCDILPQGLIGLIEYSYHQGIPSFPKAHLQRTPGLSVFGSEQFQDG
jgi:hypothetical protein